MTGNRRHGSGKAFSLSEQSQLKFEMSSIGVSIRQIRGREVRHSIKTSPKKMLRDSPLMQRSRPHERLLWVAAGPHKKEPC